MDVGRQVPDLREGQTGLEPYQVLALGVLFFGVICFAVGCLCGTICGRCCSGRRASVAARPPSPRTVRRLQQVAKGEKLSPLREGTLPKQD